MFSVFIRLVTKFLFYSFILLFYWFVSITIVLFTLFQSIIFKISLLVLVLLWD